MKRLLLPIASLACLAFTGCVSTGQQLDHHESTFTYEFEDLDTSKTENFRTARNFLATHYGDTNQVLRVLDEDEGVIIGRGLSTWMLGMIQCSTSHDIRFVARDDRARLQFEIIKGAPATSNCGGWDWPSDGGYEKIVAEFNAFSSALEMELRGETTDSDFFNY